MDALRRCEWVSSGKGELYIEYHDREWGVPVHDDDKLFEFLTLEGAQAGLSWLTVLKRQEGYRKAFLRFDPTKVSKMNDDDFLELLNNPNVIRNKLKIQSTTSNAKAILLVQSEFGSFDNFI